MTLRRTGLRHPHTGAPIAPIGFRRDGRPILPILGAGPDDDMDEEIDDEGGEDEDEDSEDEDDDEGEDDEGGKPAVKEDGKPLTQKDYDALQLALRNARRAERRARRGSREGGRDGRDGKDGKPKGKDGKDGEGEDAPDVERIRAEAEDAAAGTWKPLLVRREAKDMLKEAGLIGDPARLLKLIDMEDVDVDPETGEIDGLDEQIDDLRKEYKHLFRRRGTRRINGADKDGRETGRSGKKLTTTELQAMQLLGDR